MGKVLCSGIFIINKNNEILICHPTNHPEDVWSIPKGKIEKGETEIEAAIRETYEETNIDLTNANHFVQLKQQTYSHKKKAITPFVCMEVKNPRINFNEFDIKCTSMVEDGKRKFPEMDDFKWSSIDECENLLHATQVACLPRIKELINK